MTKILRTVFLIIVGFAIGVLFYDQIGSKIRQSSSGEMSIEPQSEQDTAGVLISYSDNSNTAEKNNQRYQINDVINKQRANSLTNAIQKVSPAVISVNVIKFREYSSRDQYNLDPRDFFSNFFKKYRRSVGSGFLISKDGFILTNEHVVQGAQEIIIAMNDGSEFPAQIIGRDHLTDIALLKIDKQDSPFIPLGSSKNIIIGEWAIALGNPFGLFVKGDPTVTVGVISATGRDFAPQDYRIYQDMIQTDAAINHGNSGGPLCNILGEAIGMNTFIYSGESRSAGNVGIGFAIPVDRIKQIVEELKKYHGIDRNFYTGMYVQDLTRYTSRLLGYTSGKGVLVVRTDPNSPAEKAGVKIGDVITKINKNDVQNSYDAKDKLLSAALKVGDELDIEVWRANQSIEMKLKLTGQSHK